MWRPWYELGGPDRPPYTLSRLFQRLAAAARSGGLVTRPIKIVILPMVYEWVERGAARRAARRLARDGAEALEQGPDMT